LLIEAADAIEAQALRELGFGVELGNVLHEVADAGTGVLGVGHAVGPERLSGAPAGGGGGSVPVGHGNALGEPHEQVVVDGSTLLQFGNPQVSAGYFDALAVAAEAVGGAREVIGSPVVDASIGQGDEVGGGWAVSRDGSAVQCACHPHAAAKAFVAFSPAGECVCGYLVRGCL
jgi:hypothetical protein